MNEALLEIDRLRAESAMFRGLFFAMCAASVISALPVNWVGLVLFAGLAVVFAFHIVHAAKATVHLFRLPRPATR